MCVACASRPLVHSCQRVEVRERVRSLQTSRFLSTDKRCALKSRQTDARDSSCCIRPPSVHAKRCVFYQALKLTQEGQPNCCGPAQQGALALTRPLLLSLRSKSCIQQTAMCRLPLHCPSQDQERQQGLSGHRPTSLRRKRLVALRRAPRRQLPQDEEHQRRWHDLDGGVVDNVEQWVLQDVQVGVGLVDGGPSHDDGAHDEARRADRCDKPDLRTTNPAELGIV